MSRIAKMEADLAEFEQQNSLPVDGSVEPNVPATQTQEPIATDSSPAVTDQQAQAPVVVEDPNSDSYKARWEALTGMHRGYLQQIEDQRSQINTMLQEIQNLKNQQTAAPVIDDDGVYRSPLLSDAIRASRSYVKMAKDYGEEYAELHFESSVLAAQSTQAPISERLDNIQATSSVSRMEVELTRLCPSWTGLNNDSNFIEWLNKMAPYSSKTLKSILNENYAAGDAVNTAKIFNDYLAEMQRKPADPREGLVAPGNRGGGSAQPVGNQPKIWTGPQIDKVYSDYRKDLITEAEYNRLDMDIQNAIREGRVA